MSSKMLAPSYIFETSWEVCNKVGGIYTVLSTRAKTLQDVLKDKCFFIGPDFWIGKKNPLFKESKTLLKKWREYAQESEDLKFRVGRWQIPGEPIAILVDFNPFFTERNNIFGWAWENYGVNSLNAYGDYDDSLVFSWAAGRVIESYCRYFNLTEKDNVVFQAHEWQTCLAAMYVKKYVPEVATIFTTHATTTGRSIAGNGKPLYDYLFAYNGDQMSSELGVEAKHSVEKNAALAVDCFTTVSDITDRECKQLLTRGSDVILMNGFENDFVPSPASAFNERRKNARLAMLKVANALTGSKMKDDTLIVATGGRYEFKNKGIDVFTDAMNRLRFDENLKRPVLAYIFVPAWMREARTDLKQVLKALTRSKGGLNNPRITHELNEPWNDKVLDQMNYLNIQNRPEDNVKIIFVPCYLDGNDGIFNKLYYDLIIGADITVFPSYYEPWGYTPTESVAFHVPCITTDLAGFGLWANSLKGAPSEIEDGVKTIHRSDYNFEEVSETIAQTILKFSKFDNAQVKAARKAAERVAEQALWKHFIKYYYEAYDIALRKRDERLSQ
ncbi:MAG: glycogen/starch synthase [Bacteroidaceae bacterium]|nr:glycogen/starch synthase [Bacteroidaceae bacterium]